MKSVITISSLVALASAFSSSDPFTSQITTTVDGLDGSSIEANGGYLYLGKAASSYCPAAVDGLDCSLFPGGITVFISGNDTLSLDVAVPGGQQLFVTPEGAIGYTPPHSTEMPDGSVTTGFERFADLPESEPSVAFQGYYHFVACPVVPAEQYVYQIYVQALKDDITGCNLFTWGAFKAAGVNSWEY